MALFETIRRLVVFGLGVLVILEGLYGKGDPITELIVGAVMVGVLPLDDLVKWRRRPAPDAAETPPEPPT